MRSHPYTPPPPLPPLLAELSAFLPNRDRRDGDGTGASDIALSDLDPETSRLLAPRERPPHRVRVQGRLAPVRSVSVADLRSQARGARFDTGVGGGVVRRRSEDDGSGGGVGRRGGGGSEDGDEVGERDGQLRGYGIGGRGNIRRPTEVMGSSSGRSLSLSSLSIFSGSGPTTRRSVSGLGGSDKTWSLSGLLNRIEERRGRER